MTPRRARLAIIAIAIAVVIAVVGGAPRTAHADSGCTGLSSRGGRFSACFDPGNRLSVTAGSSGVGGGIALRHIIEFADEPDLEWKMEHTMLEGEHAMLDHGFSALIYRGRYLRHARDGHIVLPLGDPPRKVFLPFDIGALVEVGQLAWRPDATGTLDVVRTAALIDVSRARDFHWRLAFGPVASWSVALGHPGAPTTVTDHAVTPFSAVMLDSHVESSSGLTLGGVRVESGLAWHSATARWRPQLTAEAHLERVVLAANDRPIAIVLAARYASAALTPMPEATATIGLRVVLVDHRDPRVNLHPLTASR